MIRTIVRYAPNTATAIVTMRGKSVIAIERVHTFFAITGGNSDSTTCSPIPVRAVTTRDRYAIACTSRRQPNSASRNTRLRVVHRRTASTRVARRRIERQTRTPRIPVQQQRVQHTLAVRPDHVYTAASAAVLTARPAT